MADYITAFDYMIKHEDPSGKGLVTIDNNGGKVRYGLNSLAHPDLEKKNYYDMGQKDAIAFAVTYYNLWYWENIKGIMMANQDVANKIFDQVVPGGVVTVSKLVQRTLNYIAPTDTPELEEDGHIGPKTIDRLNHTDPGQFIAQFKLVMKRHYDLVIVSHPEYASLRNGWYNRVDV